MKNEMKWNLDRLCKKENFNKEYERIKKKITEYQKLLKKLKPNIKEKDFKDLLDFSLKLDDDFSKLSDFAQLYYIINMKDKEALALTSRISDLDTLYDEAELIFGQWIKGMEIEGMKVLDDKNAKRLFAINNDLKFVFEKIRYGKKYSLSFKEEKIWSVKDINLKSPIRKLYQMITNDFQFEFKPYADKPAKTIKTQSGIIKYVRSSKKAERHAAYKAMLKPYKDNVDKIYTIYQAIVKDWIFSTEKRGYARPISKRNFSNDVHDETIDTLIDVTKKNVGLIRKYFDIKADILKEKKLSRYDAYAPVESKKVKIDFAEGKDMVLSVFSNFNKSFYQKAKKIFDESHIDSHPRENKRSGAFCSTACPSITPHILLNYNEDVDSVMTMAHELGHGIHSLYANKLPNIASHPTLPLAETASTFSEMLIFDELLGSIKCEKEKKNLIVKSMEDIYATVFRQVYFVIFENNAYEMIKKGASEKEISELYFKTIKGLFGNSLYVPDEFRYEWAYIPHIFSTPFYCYAYGFGQLLSMSLYFRYKKEGKSFIPSIEKILASGGSADPEKLLKSIGINVRTEKFWQDSFNIVKEWVNYLKK